MKKLAMTKKTSIQIFEEKKVRTVWNDEEEKWYFSIADVVEVLTESTDVKQYIKRMRQRDSILNANWGTICTPLQMTAADGKQRLNCVSLEGRLTKQEKTMTNNFSKFV